MKDYQKQFESTKVIDLGSCAFRQWRATHSHCQYIHGYRLQAKFWFGAETLDDKNWVVDFGGLSGFKTILEDQFDHTYCVAKDDPELNKFIELGEMKIIQLRIMDDGVGIEKTAEWCLNAANIFLSDSNRTSGRKVWCNKVEVWEHEKNSAIAKTDFVLSSTKPLSDKSALQNISRFLKRELS